MLIDCARCEIRGRGCADCLVTVLFDMPEQVAGLGAAEQHAVEVFARAGFEVEILPATAPATPARPFRAA
ncbi:hypothetical protein [Micromonospora inyonensis]|uniref:Uncharacterized protein n=1 Tax=Micromonospora inyonensis TaxID=47866 RepID=A0A1C6S221_9ACTN|nr:hypothetical protein [Micromonospora inyonensis]SCL23322.1 hypothetical protein GA0074694_3615 [Micromonospora inyonensis]